MVFSQRIYSDDPPDLVGRSPEDYARELENYLRQAATVLRDSMPAGFLSLDPEPATLDSTAVSPGTEAAGWAASDHVHWIDLLLTGKGDFLTFDGTSYLKMSPGANDTFKVADSTETNGWRDEAFPPPAPDPVVVRPAQITADQNDYAPGVCSTLFLNSDADWSITGLVAGTVDGEQLSIWNNGAFLLTFLHQNAGSAAANRFQCQGGSDIVLKPDFLMRLTYDLIADFWRAVED